MKLYGHAFVTHAKRGVVIGLTAGVISFQSTDASAQIINLIDNNSFARIDVGPGGQGMFDWLVEGQDQLKQQWFYYRVGLAPEAPINSISAPLISQPTLRHLTTTYGNAAFSVQVDYVLTGGMLGSGQSDMGESILIRNLTAAPLDFHFFQYSDFDLGGTPGNDTVQLGMNLSGTRFNEAVQMDGAVAFTETVTVPGANHGEAALFNVTLLKLMDAAPTVLTDVVGPVGPGDATWAFQWDLVIPGGGSALISKDKYLELTVIPEPSPATVSLLGLGVFALTQRLRRKNR